MYLKSPCDPFQAKLFHKQQAPLPKILLKESIIYRENKIFQDKKYHRKNISLLKSQTEIYKWFLSTCMRWDAQSLIMDKLLK